MKKDLILIGGGGHCKACIDIIEQSNTHTIVGILDKQSLLGTRVLSYKVIGDDSEIEHFANKGYCFLITVGQIRSPMIRKKIFNHLIMAKAEITKVISPRAYVSKHAKIGAGSIIMHDALINSNANIGENCIINSKALIEHDVIVEDHCHISTSAIINGNTVVKEGTFFGSNATSKENITIPENSFIKANSLFAG